MKKILYIFFLIPCLCFGQLGINVTEPKAMLHLSRSESSTNALKIEGIETIPYNAEQRLLLIGDDGTLKKEKEPEPYNDFKSNKYYFAAEQVLDTSITDIKFNQRTNSLLAGYTPADLIIPATSSYLVNVTFYGEHSTTNANLDNTTFGKVTMSIYDATNTDTPANQPLLDKVEMKWVIPKTYYHRKDQLNKTTYEYSIVYSANAEIYAKKGTKLRIQLDAVKTTEATNLNLNLSPTHSDPAQIVNNTQDFISNIILFKI